MRNYSFPFTAAKGIAGAILLLSLMAVSGCRKEDMGSQPKDKPLQESVFFANGTSARTLVVGTIPQGQLHADTQLYSGFVGKNLTETFPDHYPTETDGPFPTQGEPLRRVLLNGQEKFTIFCSMCHGDAGEGNGIIVQRGFVKPPSYHIDRLRTAPVGHFYDVISNGYGAMYSYGDRISPADRWAIVAYIRTLQLSHAVNESELSPAQRAQLDDAKQVKAQ